MSYHILHLIGTDIRVRVEQNRFEITEKSNGRVSYVPIEDVAIVISATPDLILTGAVLRKMAEYRILYLICDEKFQPSGIFTPYYSVTSNETFKSQLVWSESFKKSVWKKIVNAKIRTQADALPKENLTRERMIKFSERLERQKKEEATAESIAARWYWSAFFSELGEITPRKYRTHIGVNGFLDYGYAVARSAVLRSLACHGFISAIGIRHSTKPGAHPLADDLVEPLRGMVDFKLCKWCKENKNFDEIKSWSIAATSLLTEIVIMNNCKIRLLNAIDLMIESLKEASHKKDTELLRFPRIMNKDAATRAA